MTNPQLVTLALVLLWDGVQHLPFQYTDKEDIAIKADELAPGRFAWRKYPNLIDLDAVSVALRDAKKAKTGGFLIGDNAKGWILSPTGVRWVCELNLQVDSSTLAALKDSSQMMRSFLDRERARLHRVNTYLRARTQVGAITREDMYEFAYINEYFDDRARWRRFSIIESAIEQDAALSEVWQMLSNRFPEEMAGWPNRDL